MATPTSPSLPNEYVHRYTIPIKRFLLIQSSASYALLLSLFFSLIIANTKWSAVFNSLWDTQISMGFGAHLFSRTIREVINNGAMTLFFFIISLELKYEITHGNLLKLKPALFVILSSAGGMFLPLLFFWLFMDGHPGQAALGTVMSTDTAFVIGCLALLGNRIPHVLRVFILSSSVIDDMGSVIFIATKAHEFNWHWGGVIILTLLLIFAMNYIGVRSVGSFFFMGFILWFATESYGVHGTLTGVILGLMTPTRSWVKKSLMYDLVKHVTMCNIKQDSVSDKIYQLDLKKLQIAARESTSPMERLHSYIIPWVSFFILPFFILINSGFLISFDNLQNKLTLAIVLGLAVAKPAGMVSFGWAAVKAHVAIMPEKLNWGLFIGGALLSGIGFTMAIFIAELTLNKNLLGQAKFGILIASIISAFCGIAVLSLQKSSITKPNTAYREDISKHK